MIGCPVCNERVGRDDMSLYDTGYAHDFVECEYHCVCPECQHEFGARLGYELKTIEIDREWD